MTEGSGTPAQMALMPGPGEGVGMAEARARLLLEPLATQPRHIQVAAIRQRFPYFAARALRVRPKEGGETWPLVLNPIQADYLRGLRARYRIIAGVDTFRGIRDLIVKPRQLGFSTLIAGLYFQDGFFNPGRITVILTHDQRISEELLFTYRTYWEKMPGFMKAGLRLVSDSKYSLAISFPKKDGVDQPLSRFFIATEAGHDWRGGVIHNLHASEAAFYGDYQAFKNSFLQAVPSSGNACLETTANGQNLYYSDVLAALEHEDDPSMPWRVVFYEWFRHPEYRKRWIAAQSALTAEEAALMGQHHLDLDQIAWRRSMVTILGDAFPQEYPESLLGAFLSTGRPFFDQLAVAAQVDRLRREPVVPTQEGPHLKVWEPYDPRGVYLLCADTAEGLERGKANPFDPEIGGSDFSSAYVIDTRNLRVVAALHGRITPPDFARAIAMLGRRYRAVVAVERNNHGHTVLHALAQADYPAIYRHLEYDEGTGRRYLAPGFPTSTKTRPQILDALEDAIRRRALLCDDARFWAEAHKFHRNERGKPEAMDGAHDDRVMSMAIGVYLATLGRSGWGVDGTEASESFGFAQPLAVPAPAPVAALPVTGPVVPAAPGDHPDRAFKPEGIGGANLWVEVAAAKEQVARATCGGCLHFAEGRCKVYRFTVKATDPGCESHYPLDDGAFDDPFSGAGGD